MNTEPSQQPAKSTAKHLGEFEMLVLAALIRLEPEAYGVTVRQEIEQKTSRSVSIGALYATLSRLESKQYVESWLGETTPERGGRAKRYYKITALGQAQLQKSVTELGNLLDGIMPWPTTTIK